MMIRRSLAMLFALLGILPAVRSANLFPEDTGFETGIQNFSYYRSEDPIHTVTGDAAGGKSSLEIDTRVCWAHGRWGYAIRKDTDYTMSFYARRVSGGDRIRFTMIGVLDWKREGDTTFQISDEWRRYSCRIRTDRSGTVLYPAFLSAGEPLVFRIDNLQLETGSETTPYRPAEPFSAYAGVNGGGEVVFTPAIPELAVRLYNAEIPEERQPFTLDLTIPGTEIRETHESRLAPEAVSEERFRFKQAVASGYYPAELEIRDRTGKSVKKTAAPFVVTAPFPAQPEPGFFGIQDSSLPRVFLPRIGTSYLRTGFNSWKQMEPREGDFRTIDFDKPATLFWHPTMHSEFTPGQIPGWGFKPGTKEADPKKAARFLEEFFKQFQGKAEFVDFINEPDLEFRNMPNAAEYYIELLKTAAPIARKYGIKLMIDSSGNRSEFFEKVFEQANDSFKISGPHPYCSPRIIAADGRFCAPPETGEFASTMREQSKLAREHHKEFLIGELGYSLEEAIPFHAPEAHLHAAFLARMFLLARSYPECRHLIWFTGLDRWESGPYLYGIWRTQNGVRPLPAVAAYAQAAHEIDHAEAELLLDSDIKLLRIRKAGRTSYAVWNAGDEREPLPLAGLPPDAAPRSIYGTPLKPETAAVTGAPVYLSENADGTVLPALRKAIDARPPLTVRGYLRDRNTLKLELRNRSFSDWRGEIETMPLSGSEPLTVPRQSIETVTVKSDKNIPPALTVEMRGKDGRTFRQSIRLPATIQVRQLDVKNLATFDFRSLPGAIEQSTREHVYPADPSIPWHGADDLSHRTWLGWDDDNLYLFSDVRDDAQINPYPDTASWKGDSVQLGLDPFNDADGKLAYDSDDSEFTFAPGKKPWSHQGPPTRKSPAEAEGVHQIITRSEETGTTTYRIAIPRRLLSPLKLREGTVFGLALCFNDEDPGEPRYIMAFGQGIANEKCAGKFLKMELSR